MIKRIVALILIVLCVCAVFTACDNNGGNIGDGENNKNFYYGEISEDFLRSYKVSDVDEFEYRDYEEGIIISKYIGDKNVVVVPDKIGEKNVIAIGPFVFSKDIRAVLLPLTVTKIVRSFDGNEDLEMVIGEGLTFIDDHAFSNCTSLHTIIFSHKLDNLGTYAFKGCTNLKRLYIPRTLTVIPLSNPGDVFEGCDNLTIVGIGGSYIESYCEEYGFKFEPLSRDEAYSDGVED